MGSRRLIEVVGRLKATSRCWFVCDEACQPCAAAAFLCSKQPPVVRRGSKRVRLVETRAAWPFQIEGAAGWCQNTATHAQRVEATVGTLCSVCRRWYWRRGWARIDAEKVKAPAVHQTCKETNAREKKWVRGRRSEADAWNKFKS